MISFWLFTSILPIKMFQFWFWNARDFSKLRKTFEDFSPSSYQLHILLILIPFIFSCYILSSFSLVSVYSRLPIKSGLVSSVFNLFSKYIVSIFLFRAISFEKWMENVLISYLSYSIQNSGIFKFLMMFEKRLLRVFATST